MDRHGVIQALPVKDLERRVREEWGEDRASS